MTLRKNSFGNRSRKTIGAHVNQNYLGNKLGNSQDPDEPYDQSDPYTGGGNKIGGQGAQGGGSKVSPQISKTTTGTTTGGSRSTPSSYPRNAQRLRG